MSRAKFFYAHGTAYAVHWPEIVGKIYSALTPAMEPPPPGTLYRAAGLNGQSFGWSLGPPDDPFPDMLDLNVWEPIRVPYWGVTVPMGLSIDSGIDWVVDYLLDSERMPPGTPFALGGYSQGAAVMSGVLKELQSGSVTSRYSQMLGGVMYGNPRRMQGWRGPIGGTWDGSWDVPGSNTGGHGSFPTTGSWARMTTNPPDTWVEFTAPNDIFSATSSSQKGLWWTAGNATLLDLTQSGILNYFFDLSEIVQTVTEAFDLGNGVNNFVDAVGTPFEFPGAGHTSYAFKPPAAINGTFPASGDTCYQLALKYLNGLAGEWATTPIVVPDASPAVTGWQNNLATSSPTLSAGWSTTL